MAQRDIGPTGPYIDPTTDAPPAGFGGQGVVNNAHEALPTVTPTGPPPGFGGQGALASTTQYSNSLPSPPEGYHPGPMAPARHEYEDSTMFKIGSVLASYGESVPINLQLKMAQQEADLKQHANKRAWDNYYANNEAMRATLQAHARDAQKDFLSMWPNIKGQISSTIDPVKRKELADHWGTLAESLSPGSGKLVAYFNDNMASVLDGDDLLGDEDASVSGPAQKVLSSMGYDNWIMSKERQQMSAVRNVDRTASVVGRMAKPMQEKLASARAGTGPGPDEIEFRKEFKQTLLQSGLRTTAMMAAQLFLDTEQGQNMMTGLGVRTNAITAQKQKKSHELSDIERGRNEEYTQKKSLLEDAASNPGKYTESYLKTVKDEVAVFHKLQAPETSPGPNPNNTFNNALKIKSRGKLSSADDIAKLPLSEQQAAYALADKTLDEVREASAQAQMQARMDTPHDNAGSPVFEMTPNGEIKRVKIGSEREYRTGKHFKMTPEQLKKTGEFQYVKSAGLDLLDKADLAYTAKTEWEFKKQQAAELAMTDPLTDKLFGSAAKKAYPRIADYVAGRGSQLGKFARSLGGEVGVLTDQDIFRVEKMFPTASDTSYVRKLKRNAFLKLVELNKTAITTALIGNEGTGNEGQLSVEQMADLKTQYKSTVDGILGSIEGIDSRTEGPPSKAKKPAALQVDPATPAAPSVHRGESLRERMLKGK